MYIFCVDFSDQPMPLFCSIWKTVNSLTGNGERKTPINKQQTGMEIGTRNGKETEMGNGNYLGGMEDSKNFGSCITALTS